MATAAGPERPREHPPPWDMSKKSAAPPSASEAAPIVDAIKEALEQPPNPDQRLRLEDLYGESKALLDKIEKMSDAIASKRGGERLAGLASPFRPYLARSVTETPAVKAILDDPGATADQLLAALGGLMDAPPLSFLYKAREDESFADFT